ncbi:cyclin-domain-containing protein [Ascobolus immersus RN42]|uniref:Cyclin-domain-containing protein n=1 Tax=Ascobolus immersus RN42 TaxID=1160509 RepID=A0A3N4INK3_ASCIM|nr:cyclin-domain-containing protein [Ascobolus immersus RN42]
MMTDVLPSKRTNYAPYDTSSDDFTSKHMISPGEVSPPPPYTPTPTTNSFGDKIIAAPSGFPVHHPSMARIRASAPSSPNSSFSGSQKGSIAGTEVDSDVFSLPATSALILLARSVELLVSLTPDSLPTPPASTCSTPQPHGCTRSEYFPASPASTCSSGFGVGRPSDVDGVFIKKRTPEAESVHDIGHGANNNAQQLSAVTRKFWVKSVPGVSIEDYLFRIHRFCPLSTAVYLAASIYIHRIAILDRTMPVTRLNVHRLLLAALRVANKGLEDMVHSHSNFSKVGGVSETQLASLEISFCYLISFELRVDEATLQRQLISLREAVNRQALIGISGLLPRHSTIVDRRVTGGVHAASTLGAGRPGRRRIMLDV